MAPALTTIARKTAKTAVTGDSVKKPAPKASTAKASKGSAPKKARVHPPYFEMIKEAIMTLKERTGSSQYAIAKFIEEKQKDLPSNFKRLLLVQLKKLVASGKLTKVKNSFKLSAIPKPISAAASEKPKAAVKAKKEPIKRVAAGTGGKKPIAAASGKQKKAAPATKEPAKKVTVKGDEGKEKKRTAVAAAAKVKKTPVKKPKSIKSPAKKLKK